MGKLYICCQRIVTMMDQSKDLISKLTKALFWDVLPDRIDVQKHAPYIVERVLTRGTLEDFRLIKAYYGKTRIRQIAMSLRYLDERVLQFCSVYFNTPVTKFGCYTST